jgi:hypothetical protein
VVVRFLFSANRKTQFDGFEFREGSVRAYRGVGGLRVIARPPENTREQVLGLCVMKFLNVWDVDIPPYEIDRFESIQSICGSGRASGKLECRVREPNDRHVARC